MSYRFRPIFGFHSSLTKPPGMLLFKDAISFPQTTATAIWRLTHKLYDPHNFFLISVQYRILSLNVWSNCLIILPYSKSSTQARQMMLLTVCFLFLSSCQFKSCLFVCPSICIPVYNFGTNKKYIIFD